MRLQASCAYLNAEILGDRGGLSRSGARCVDRTSPSIALSVVWEATKSVLRPLLYPTAGLIPWTCNVHHLLIARYGLRGVEGSRIDSLKSVSVLLEPQPKA